MIYLLGAGPGDEGLISVKGLNLLKRADVIIYDHLAAPGLLRHAKPEARLICVGKRSGQHSASQAEINQLLLLEGARSSCVVRLKGGDPFVFGRGGEEAEVLAGAGIAFEVVPGISSAIAGPAYAGIPLTHRDKSSSLAIITGHNCVENKACVNWQALAQAVDTLVILMGMEHIDNICQKLMQAGKPAHTPAALVQNATTPQQKKLVCTLGELAQKSRENNFSAPAVIVIGEVASLGLGVSWFEKLPLLGKTVVVTRATHQASELSSQLQSLGAQVLEFPAIAIQPVPDPAPVFKAIEELNNYNWLVFTSCNGVKHFFHYLFQAGKDARALGGCKLAAMGPGTAACLEAFGLRPDFIPTSFIAEELAKGLIALPENKLKAQHFLIARASKARDVLETELAHAGHKVELLGVYQTLLPPEDEPRKAAQKELLTALEKGGIDVISFASSSCVDNFFQCVSAQAIKQNPNICLACIGPVTGLSLQKYGLTSTIQPEIFTLTALVDEISAYFTSQT